jgi:hypothetical protein
MMCPHCTSRKVLPGYQTCGNSYCQQASFYLNIARNARARSTREKRAYDKYNECCRKAAQKGR